MDCRFCNDTRVRGDRPSPGSEEYTGPLQKTDELAIAMRPLRSSGAAWSKHRKTLRRRERQLSFNRCRKWSEARFKDLARDLPVFPLPGTDSSRNWAPGWRLRSMRRGLRLRCSSVFETRMQSRPPFHNWFSVPLGLWKLKKLPFFVSKPSEDICAESDLTPAYEGPTTRLLPTTVRQRLEAVSVRLAGDIARAEQVEEAYSTREAERVAQVGQAYVIPVAAGGIGLFILLFHRRIRKRLTLYPGLRERSLFPTDGLRLYLVLIGWFGFSSPLRYSLNLADPWASSHNHPACPCSSPHWRPVVFAGFDSPNRSPETGSLWDALGLHIHGFERRVWVLGFLGVLGYCAAVPLTASASAFTQLITGETPVMTHPIIWMLAEAESTLMVVLLVVGACGVAPLFEEILFRGFLFQVLRERIGGTLSILVSSLIFAALHPSPFTILPLFL